MTIVQIYSEAIKPGLRLEPRGDRLAVIPARLCAPDFANVLRQHKSELLDLLEGQAAGLPPDQAPWLHVARQVLNGEFDGADRSTVATLTIGLRSIPHPICGKALRWLRDARKDSSAP